MPESARTDKWLWAVRLCKTRGLAAEMCAAGKVKRTGHSLKAATTLHPGDVLVLPFPEGPGVRSIRVLSILQLRVGAPQARACYEDLTLPEIYETQRLWHAARNEGMKGRPTKKDRRDIDKIHGFWD
ncbi:MAG: RNA-binding S4 domain-containing protein [Gloeobacteraceae cyanobacterium ES-bin-144]|nr:RNA-binding S4 domain-containing protein [Verrucomicrobiales bacterium]